MRMVDGGRVFKCQKHHEGATRFSGVVVQTGVVMVVYLHEALDWGVCHDRRVGVSVGAPVWVPT